MSSPSFAAPAGSPGTTLGPEARWAARRAGFHLFDWQAGVLDAAMATKGPEDDRLLRSQVTLVCPRRNGKTQLLMARILAGCLAWDEASILYTAHLGDTARHTFTAFLELLNNSPWLQAQVDSVKYGKGDEGVRFRNGSTFSIRARTASGGRGLECSTLILDEALELRDDHVSALTPLLARANAEGAGQLWLVSSAGHGRSEVLARARDRGRAAAAGEPDPDLAYFEWCASRDADPADPDTWATANPSLGTPVLGPDFLRMQQRSMSGEEFGREHLGWWSSEVAAPFLPHGAWAAGEVPDAPPLPSRALVAFGIEVQDFGRRAALVAGVALGEQVWTETLHRWANPDGIDLPTVAEQVRGYARTLRPVTIAGDEFTCTAILDHLERRHPVTRLNMPQLRAASQSLLLAATSGRLVHPPDPVYAEELANAGQAATGDGLTRLSRKHSSGPSTAAFATAAAVWVITNPLTATRPAITVAP